MPPLARPAPPSITPPDVASNRPNAVASSSRGPLRGAPKKVSNFACESCKQRKRKCDGGRPRCSSCARSKSAVCFYKNTPSAVYVNAVERQLATLTDFLDHLVRSDSLTRDTLLDDLPADVAPLLGAQSQPINAVRSHSESELESTLDDISPPDAPELRVDGYDRRGLHGPSSLFYLEPPAAADAGVAEVHAPATSSIDWLQATIDSEYSSTMEWLGFLNVNTFVPEYRPGVFEAFLQLHWTWVQPFFGFVYRPAFMREMVTSTAGSSAHFSIFLLLTICGHVGRSNLGDFDGVEVNDLVGALADSGLDANRPRADNVFLRQARLLLFQEIEKDAPRQIPTIQGLLLLGAKECSEGKIGRAWMMTGMAIRMLQDLGIHLDGDRSTSDMPATDEATEIRRRVFWTAYIWDKFLSLYFGRTPMLQLSQRTPPKVFLDASGDTEMWRPYGTHSYTSYEATPTHSIANFTAVCGLSEIITLVLLYDAGEADASNIKLARVKLQEWRAALPAHLTINPSQLPPVCPPAHIVNMNCVSLMIALLIYRRSRRVAAPSRESVQVALDITSLARLNFDAFGDRPAVLSHCYCMYQAATTLMQALKLREPRQRSMTEAAPMLSSLSWLLDRLSSAAASTPALVQPLAVLKAHLESIEVLRTGTSQPSSDDLSSAAAALPLQPPFTGSNLLPAAPFDLAIEPAPTDPVFSPPSFDLGPPYQISAVSESNGLDALLQGMFDAVPGSEASSTPPDLLQAAARFGAGVGDDPLQPSFWHRGGGEFAVSGQD